MTANPNKEILIDAYRPGADLVPKSGFPFRDDGKPHKGVDWSNGNSAGTPIYASMGGKVTHVGKAEGYGQWVIVETQMPDGSKISTVYGHVVGNVTKNSEVFAGEHIGDIGSVSELKQGWDHNPLGSLFSAPHLHHQMIVLKPNANTTEKANYHSIKYAEVLNPREPA